MTAMRCHREIKAALPFLFLHISLLLGALVGGNLPSAFLWFFLFALRSSGSRIHSSQISSVDEHGSRSSCRCSQRHRITCILVLVVCTGQLLTQIILNISYDMVTSSATNDTNNDTVASTQNEYNIAAKYPILELLGILNLKTASTTKLVTSFACLCIAVIACVFVLARRNHKHRCISSSFFHSSGHTASNNSFDDTHDVREGNRQVVLPRAAAPTKQKKLTSKTNQSKN